MLQDREKATLAQLLPLLNAHPTSSSSPHHCLQLQEQPPRENGQFQALWLLFLIPAVFLGYREKRGMVKGDCASAVETTEEFQGDKRVSQCLVVPVNKTFANCPGQEISWIFAWFWNFYDFFKESDTPSCGYSSPAAC